ncbi:lectin 5-like [Lotus japonicus]|uniref:lectin 5-like n=1 Tax=Lotus japonicus TaxID=34305 RepID=UPI002583E92E|nr:lectin 5-like [Lotus japonicus]
MANFSSELLATLIFSLLLITTVKSNSLSFSFPTFDPNVRGILLNGDANTTNGILQLTKIDQYGNPSPHSSGISAFYRAVHLSDIKTGNVANFTTEFSFVVNHSQPHGDGFTFFLASLDFEFPEGEGGGGGFLGLFDEETAYNTSKNSIVAIEFDSFSNSFDPSFPHIGIDINTIKSVVTVPWSVNDEPQGAIGNAKISYSSNSGELIVDVSYSSQNSTNVNAIVYPIDFGDILSEWVMIGFSAATGEFAETHSILSWSFTSTL